MQNDVPPIRFLTSGAVDEADTERAGRVVREVLADSTEPISAVRVTLSVLADPALPRPALVQADVELGGRRVRAQAAAPTPAQAVGLLRTRLALRTRHRQAG
ncbi:hypothetical protein DPM19_03890 [Actinomadura craniellae]|uniref:Uncharacterized protein n=1 Tax=Actinomadura craniellae TaxID=2231787 RepID=A0A365HAB4_9ACTN|nr:hypothetical protein [Actinomadura craniellae]RAY16084.1 hypothetical protein DPM19_03890 [Actinomadura craniellae]